MPFENDKKTFLEKLDRSKKGSIDGKAIPIIEVINGMKDYYTTSSCSGRAHLWRGSGRKNEMEWLRVSHDLIDEDFLKIEEEGLIWLRVEPFILHVACRDLEAANEFLGKVRVIYKKSSILSANKKVIVEVRGSEFIEMPLYKDKELLFNVELSWLTELVNQKLKKNGKK
jgi:tRNA wybutosine-synthesizing protein 3